MAVDREGNVLLPPGSSSKPFSKSYEILASYARFTQKGRTIKAGQGVLEAGTFLVREAATKKYLAYDAAANAGTGNGPIKGVLRNSVDTDSGDRLGNIVLSGILKRSILVQNNPGGAAAVTTALTDLNAREDVDQDWVII